MMRDKPAYRIPMMAEIERSPLNGLRVVSLFSGCGGSSLGYRMAGCKVVWANEFIPAARDTYRANFPNTPVDGRDIRLVKGVDILNATGLQRGELDILDGSPPCASFSTAGKRNAHWGQVKTYSDTKQRTDDLFFEYIRLLGELHPRRFIAENVAGLVKGVGKGYFLEILAGLKAAGYRVEARLLDAQWLGVPQSRQRIFFVGVRLDIDGAPGFPEPLRYRYSVRDALPWIGGVEGANGYNGHAEQPAGKPAATIQASRPVDVMTKRGTRSAGLPAPTVVTHGRAHTRNELTVRLRHGNKAPFDHKGKPIRLDQPLPTVMGGDTLGLAPFQFEIETEAEIQANRPVRIIRGSKGNFDHVGEQMSLDRPCPTILAGDKREQPGRQFIVEREADMTRFAVGRELDKLVPGQISKRYTSLVRSRLNGPSNAVTAAGGNGHTASVAHPTERRKFSIAELRRICGFPDDFILTGTYAQQWERLGRAVPPPMMAALARANAVAEPLREAESAAATPTAENGLPPAGARRSGRRAQKKGDRPEPVPSQERAA